MIGGELVWLHAIWHVLIHTMIKGLFPVIVFRKSLGLKYIGILYFALDIVFVAKGGVAGYKFSDESC